MNDFQNMFYKLLYSTFMIKSIAWDTVLNKLLINSVKYIKLILKEP